MVLGAILGDLQDQWHAGGFGSGHQPFGCLHMDYVERALSGAFSCGPVHQFPRVDEGHRVSFHVMISWS